MKNKLIEKVYELYNMNRTQFAKFSQIPYKTLEGWETKAISGQGEILLQKFIEIKELEQKHQEELEQYREKAERYDTIQKALNYPTS